MYETFFQSAKLISKYFSKIFLPSFHPVDLLPFNSSFFFAVKSEKETSRLSQSF